jgi:hypothetical protein
MRDRILEHLRHRSFQPFRIHRSNGTVHIVRHPEQVMVTGTYLVIGISAQDAPGPEVTDTAFVSLLHVVEVVPFTLPASASH